MNTLSAPILVVDPAAIPDGFMLNGRPIPVRPAALRLIRLLASRPGKRVLISECFNELWPNSEFEAAQVFFQFGKLKKAILEHAPEHWKIIRVEPGALVLDLQPEEVSLCQCPRCASGLPHVLADIFAKSGA